MLVEMTVKDFSKVLASDSPAPGGGSVAALSGALAANLLSMVCRLSFGKKERGQFDESLSAVLEKSEALSTSLLERIDLDTDAFNAVMAAFRLPKATDGEKAARTAAIQQGYQKAVRSPLGIAKDCRDVLLLAGEMVGKSNPNALSDLGVASQQAMAGLEGAIMNVKINLPSIKDQSFVTKATAETTALHEEGKTLEHKVYAYVVENLRA